MSFCFRVDIDSAYGMRKGVPNILDLLRKLDMQASFFVVTGGETGLVDLLAGGKNVGHGAPGVKLPPWEIARVLLAPQNFAIKHAELLLDAKKQGHEIGAHGWKHREWTRNLENLDLTDRFQKIVAQFQSTFGFKPTLFTAPAFKTNLAVLNALDKFGFQAAGDLDGVKPFHPVYAGQKFNHVQVPVTLKDQYTRPLIEGLCFDGYSDVSVVKLITTEIQKQQRENGFSCFYCHDLFEGINKISVLKEVLTFVKQENIEITTMHRAAKQCSDYELVSL